jgi:putative FmdB family regulatory protein
MSRCTGKVDITMPTYEYESTDPEAACERCRERFEVRQSMREEPLTKCPQCGGPVERVISRCGISTQQSEKSMLSDKNLKAKGLTKLVNEGGGKFRKVT